MQSFQEQLLATNKDFGHVIEDLNTNSQFPCMFIHDLPGTVNPSGAKTEIFWVN